MPNQFVFTDAKTGQVIPMLVGLSGLPTNLLLQYETETINFDLTKIQKKSEYLYLVALKKYYDERKADKDESKNKPLHQQKKTKLDVALACLAIVVSGRDLQSTIENGLKQDQRELFYKTLRDKRIGWSDGLGDIHKTYYKYLMTDAPQDKKQAAADKKPQTAPAMLSTATAAAPTASARPKLATAPVAVPNARDTKFVAPIPLSDAALVDKLINEGDGDSASEDSTEGFSLATAVALANATASASNSPSKVQQKLYKNFGFPVTGATQPLASSPVHAAGAAAKKADAKIAAEEKSAEKILIEQALFHEVAGYIEYDQATNKFICYFQVERDALVLRNYFEEHPVEKCSMPVQHNPAKQYASGSYGFSVTIQSNLLQKIVSEKQVSLALYQNQNFLGY